jgi:putative hydrolase of the HAD superfamily
MGIGADEALMVGDWPERDIVGAAELGIRTVFARYGDTFGTQVSHADYDVDDVFDVVGIVKSLNGWS